MRPRRALGGLLAVALCAAAAMARPALAHGAADAADAAAGRKHAAKANALAAKNRCKAAVIEFGKAYHLLRDATLLFNRAECYRQIGQAAQALNDYELFLACMPEAPNRKTVEARIADLRARLGKPPLAGAAARSPAPRPPASATPPAPPDASPTEPAEKWVD